MTLDDVIKTLETTIQGKQGLLAEFERVGPFQDPVRTMVTKVTCDFLRVNLTELNNILDHVKLVREGMAEAETKAAEDSWRDNLDRSGGQFTFEEIADSRGWYR